MADANDRNVPSACSPRHLHRLFIVCVILLVSHSTQYLGPEGEGEGDRFGELEGLGDGGFGDEEGEGEGPGGEGDVGGDGGVGLSGRMTKQPAHSTAPGWFVQQQRRRRCVRGLRLLTQDGSLQGVASSAASARLHRATYVSRAQQMQLQSATFTGVSSTLTALLR